MLGDLGPTGLRAGQGVEAAWAAAYREQAGALVAAGVDGLHVETGLDLREVRVAVREAVAVAGGRPVLASFALGWRDGDWRSLAGDPAARCWEAALAAGAAAVGANCQVSSGPMRRIAARARALFPGVPLVLQPNAGQPRAVEDGFRYDEDPAVFARDMAAAARGGPALVGGCCGTDARFLAALRAALEGGGTG